MENPRKTSISQRSVANQDILRNAVGDRKPIANYDILRNADGDIPVVIDKAIIAPKKVTFAGTTDKMGITDSGRLTRSFFWGAAIAITAGLVIAWKYNKITFNYTK